MSHPWQSCQRSLTLFQTFLNQFGAPRAALMQRTLFKFIWRHSFRQQVIILVLTALSFPSFYYSLDLPKTIINQAIQGKGFPKTLFGFEFNQIQYLMMLSSAFLA